MIDPHYLSLSGMYIIPVKETLCSPPPEEVHLHVFSVNPLADAFQGPFTHGAARVSRFSRVSRQGWPPRRRLNPGPPVRFFCITPPLRAVHANPPLFPHPTPTCLLSFFGLPQFYCLPVDFSPCEWVNLSPQSESVARLPLIRPCLLCTFIQDCLLFDPPG